MSNDKAKEGDITEGSFIALSGPPFPTCVTIGNTGKGVIVAFYPDRIELGEGVTPSDGAKAMFALLSPMLRGAAVADPLAGIPEPHRSRIEAEAKTEGAIAGMETRGEGGTIEDCRASDRTVRDRTLTASVAAYRAAQPVKPVRLCSCGAPLGQHEAYPITAACDLGQPDEPEMLTREQAESALLALGHHPHMAEDFLHGPRKRLANNSYLRPGTERILRAYVCYLDKQAQTSAAPTRQVLSVDEYQKAVNEKAVNRETFGDLNYLICGLIGETGELAEEVKRVMRDDGGVLTPDRVVAIRNEAGDVLWHISAIATRGKARMADEIRLGEFPSVAGSDQFHVVAITTAIARLAKAVGDVSRAQPTDSIFDLFRRLKAVCDWVGVSMLDVAHANLRKITGRVARGTVNGSGDR